MVTVFAKEKFKVEEERFAEKHPALSRLLSKDCTGVLIAPHIVLTAAHCVCAVRLAEDKDISVRPALPGRDASVEYKDVALKGLSVVARANSGSECEGKVEVKTVRYNGNAESMLNYEGVAVAHGRFELVYVRNDVGIKAGWVDSDLALVVLSKSVVEIPTHQLESELPVVGAEVLMIGYGEGDTHPTYGYRHVVDNKITGFDRSETDDIRLLVESIPLSEGKFTGYTTLGDSGGGCVDKKQPMKLLGIASKRFTASGGGPTSVFTSVSAHMAWIQEQINLNPPPPPIASPSQGK